MDGTFPWENMKRLAELGVLGMAVPEEYGGLGLPVFDTALVLEEIAKTCYVTAMAVLGEVGVQTRIIATYAPEAIKQRILPAVCSGENLHAIRFEDCELPPENLVLEDGFRKLLSAFNTQRCLNPSISLGLAEGALEEAVKYVKERRAFGRAIGDFQGMRWKIAEMYRDIEASRSILYRACATADPFPDPLLAAAAKVTVNEMALRVTSDAIQVHGGYGFTDEF